MPEISVLKDTELGKSEAHWGRTSVSSLVSTTSEAKPSLLELVLRRRSTPWEGTGRGPPRRGFGLWIQQQAVGGGAPPCPGTLCAHTARTAAEQQDTSGNLPCFCHEPLQHFEDTRSFGVTFTVGKKNRGLQEQQMSTSLFLIF